VSTADALPNRRVERWRWSDVRTAVGELPPVGPKPASTIAATDLAGVLDPAEIVIEDGHVTFWPEQVKTGQPAVFSKKVAEVEPRRNAEGSPLAAIAVGGFADDWFPIIESREHGGIALLRHVGQNGRYSRHSRIGVSVRPGEKLTLVEIFEGPHAGFTNTLSECFVAPGAEFTRIVLQPAASEATIVCTGEVFLGDGALFRQFALAEGGKLARVETDVWTGAKSRVELGGVYLAAKARHADLTSQVMLGAEGTEVRQLVRGAARKGGRGVFQGRFKVERGAQKTDAQMEHNALLLEEGAEVFAKPELEIYADDVQCAHGNTAGQLDEAAIFYLRQRGLPEVEARALITRAFLIEAVPNWLDESIRADVEARVDRWLGAAA
jgi:Fe-S cluster assembly protein SufD